MAFATGLILIDAPASALNNRQIKTGESKDDNASGVKFIRSTDGSGKVYPYVSAQSFRYWLRESLNSVPEWAAAPTYKDNKVAFTEGDPIEWWDDDLLGFMRAQKKETLTRVSPFRVSTLVSVAPVFLVQDFGSMTRTPDDDAYPVPFTHEFYRATLKGLFSLDLHAAGTFSYRNKTGFRNLDDVRVKMAEERKLEHLSAEKSYRLPLGERVSRVAALFEGLAQLEGGAKLTLHYTDVMPAFAIIAITKGGNHIFNHIVGASDRGVPRIKVDALAEALTVFKDELLSDVYVGWTRGYLDEQRAAFEEAINIEDGLLHFAKDKIRIAHPRDAFQALAADMRESKNTAWLH